MSRQNTGEFSTSYSWDPYTGDDFQTYPPGMTSPYSTEGSYYQNPYADPNPYMQPYYPRGFPSEMFEPQDVGHSTYSTFGPSTHSSGSKETFRCTDCDVVFRERSDLVEHMRAHILYACKVCFERFSIYDHLREHMKQHSKGDIEATKKIHKDMENLQRTGKVIGIERQHNHCFVVVEEDDTRYKFTTSDLAKVEYENLPVGSLVSFKIHWSATHRKFKAANVHRI